MHQSAAHDGSDSVHRLVLRTEQLLGHVDDSDLRAHELNLTVLGHPAQLARPVPSRMAAAIEGTDTAAVSLTVGVEEEFLLVDPATGRPRAVAAAGGGRSGRADRLFAAPTSHVAQCAGFAQHNMWVTPYAEDERFAAGDYPNQSRR